MVKKKTLLLIWILAICTVFATLITGCSVVRKNEERALTKPIVTVSYGGKDINISRNELYSAYNTYYQQYSQYIQYGLNITAEEIWDIALQSTINEKYRLMKAQETLLRGDFTVNDKTYTFTERNAAPLAGAKVAFSDSTSKDVLTLAEYTYAVYNIHQSVYSSADSYVATAYQQDLVKKINGSIEQDKFEVIKIDFDSETYDYLKKEYYVGQGIDTDRIKMIFYVEGTFDAAALETLTKTGVNHITVDADNKATEDSYIGPFIVPEANYKTAFSSAAAATGSLLELTYQKKAKDSSGEVVYSSLELVTPYSYDVTAPRPALPTSTATNSDLIVIGEARLDRYASKQTIDAELAKYDISIYDANGNAELDLTQLLAKYIEKNKWVSTDADEIKRAKEAFRKIEDNLRKNYRLEEDNNKLTLLYYQTFDSIVLSVISEEVKKAGTLSLWNDKTGVATADMDNLVYEQFMKLYAAEKLKYDGLTDEEKLVLFRETSIVVASSQTYKNYDTFYYYPGFSDDGTLEYGTANEYLSNGFYVYQINISYETEYVNAILDIIGSNTKADGYDTLKRQLQEFFESKTLTKVSNENYNPDYDCPLHELGDTDEDCKWETDPENKNDGKICPSLAYVLDADGAIVKAGNAEIEAAVIAAIDAAAAEGITVFEAMEKFVYRYNDDPGITSSAVQNGYYISPLNGKDRSGFAKEFVAAAHLANGESITGTPFDGKADLLTTGLAKAYFWRADPTSSIQLIIVSRAPFATDVWAQNGVELFGEDTAKGVAAATKDEIIAYIKDFKLAINGHVKDANGVIDATIYSAIRDKLVTDKKTLVYSDWNRENVPTDLNDGNSAVTKDEKILEEILKEIKGE
ncbi:MAG: hypothetical protein LBN25_05030 [Christensenellaceae bacterium]|jgi:hypothetical protein|nr:hypothetical protein [Christensenellaceae bacterium]